MRSVLQTRSRLHQMIYSDRVLSAFREVPMLDLAILKVANRAPTIVHELAHHFRIISNWLVRVLSAFRVIL